MISIVIVSLIGGAIISYFLFRKKNKKGKIDASVIIERVEKVSKLITHEFLISDVIDIYPNEKLKEKGDKKDRIAIKMINVVVSLGFDLETMEYELVNDKIIIKKIPETYKRGTQEISEKEEEVTIKKGTVTKKGLIQLSKKEVESKYIKKQVKEFIDTKIKESGKLEEAMELFVKNFKGSMTAIGISTEIVNNIQSEPVKAEKLTNEIITKYNSIQDLNPSIEESYFIKLKLQALINMVKADKVLHEDEKEYINSLVQQSGLPKNEQDELISELEYEELIQIDFSSFKTNRNEAIDLLEGLAEVAKVDEEFHDLEKKYIIKVASEVGIAHDEVEKILNE